ncbi:hypothetical protein O6H91_Y099400 [Diphasiastrum complanatum]|nr:hypothetical protein O6H91_Y099400 [Diphasiastrum complanatum]
MARVKSEKGQATLPFTDRAVSNGGDQHQSNNVHQEADQVAGESPVDQTSTQRRMLRADYRSIKESIAVDKESLMQAHPHTFNSMIGKVDKLHAMVQRPREQIADAEAVLDISSTLLNFIKVAQHKDGVSPAEFISGIIHSFGMADFREQSRGNVNGEQESECHIDWGALGLQATSVLCEAPGICTMLGPMDILPKQRRAPVAQRRRDRPADVTRPEEVEDVDEANRKTETDKNMEAMFKILRTLRSVQLEALVLNRVSFSQTVENIFALSFLVKDGRAEITYGEDGRHLVVPRNAPTAHERAGGKVVNSQFVFRFDFRDWKLMLESLQEGKELMPHRTSSPSGNQIASLTPIRKNSRNRARETPVGLESLADGEGQDDDGDHEEIIVSTVPKRPRSRPYQ